MQLENPFSVCHLMPGGAMKIIAFTYILKLTEVAGEGGPDLAPQKFLLSQQFRYLMSTFYEL